MLFASGKAMPDGVEGEIIKKDKHFGDSNRFICAIKDLTAQFSPKMNRLKFLKMLNKANPNHLFLHGPFSQYCNVVDHPLIKWADIIHLHFVAGFIDYPTFFKAVKKPIVWTLHDKFPAVGVQHYCSAFYPVSDSLKPIDAISSTIKRKGVMDAHSLNLVAISEQMLDICQNSEVLRGFPLTLIHNGVDTGIFKPYDRQEVRKALGLLPDSTIFLFSSCNLNDPNKGLYRICEALEKVDLPNKLLVCIGQSSTAMPLTSFPIIQTGLLTSQDRIAKYYSASNFVFQCSYEETFGQTLLEAMACGIPVISTPCSGAIDLIRPFNGLLCSGFDPDSIALGINEALSHHYDATIIRQNVIDNFQYPIIARKYKSLYQSILGAQ